MVETRVFPKLFWISPGSGVGPELYRRLSSCVSAGLRAFQLREKGSFAGHLLDAARDLRRLIPKDEGVFMVNDRVDVALAADLDGAHLGFSSFQAKDARGLLGADRLVGVSVHNQAELERAIEGGADFVFASPVFPVFKKGQQLTQPMGPIGLRKIVEASPIPVFALGGMTPERVGQAMDAGAHGVAVLSAIARSDDPAAVVGSFLAELS